MESTGAYEDLSELICVALENQLALEEEQPNRHGADLARSAAAGAVEQRIAANSDALLRLPTGSPPTTEAPRSNEPLYSMTNRLFPLKIAARVLANLDPGTNLQDFRVQAARAARTLGQRLRNEDARLGIRGPERRWIALPVGDDEEAALARFAQHFAIGVNGDGAPSGPLADLSLATVVDGLPCLTLLGAELAVAVSPVLDDPGGQVRLLSDAERGLLRKALGSNPGELQAIREFIQLAMAHGRRQADVDAALRHAHGSWSEAQAVAHRAAMVGRLRDLGCASVEGRGPSARIRLMEGIELAWTEAP